MMHAKGYAGGLVSVSRLSIRIDPAMEDLGFGPGSMMWQRDVRRFDVKETGIRPVST
jgi:hypothetical protein